ncbi:MAG: hypothetical protein WC516_05305 [Patescibacteria group bacterium]|jgi:hypothetical protein
MCNHHFHTCYCHICYCHQYCSCCGAYVPSGHYYWCCHYKPTVIYVPTYYPPQTQINIKIELPKPLAKRKSKNDW